VIRSSVQPVPHSLVPVHLVLPALCCLPCALFWLSVLSGLCSHRGFCQPHLGSLQSGFPAGTTVPSEIHNFTDLQCSHRRGNPPFGRLFADWRPIRDPLPSPTWHTWVHGFVRAHRKSRWVVPQPHCPGWLCHGPRCARCLARQTPTPQAKSVCR
jgi:hypothetical protein